MATCEVLRCDNRAEHVVVVSPPDYPLMESAVCADHMREIDQGARYQFQPGEPSGGRLLMGRDLPSRAVAVEAKGGFISSGGGAKEGFTASNKAVTLFTFTVEKHDGSQHEAGFEMSQETADAVWLILSRGREHTRPVHDDTELMAAIGRMVVNTAELEYAVAELVATAEGLRDEAREERATEIVRKTGEARRQFEDLARERPELNLGWLMRDTEAMLNARHFVAHAVPQQDATAEDHPALFILSPRQGETMITTRQVQDNARLIKEGTGRIQEATATVLRDQEGGQSAKT